MTEAAASVASMVDTPLTMLCVAVCKDSLIKLINTHRPIVIDL